MSDKNQVLYYIGAGASANALPVIDGMRDRIKDLIIYLKKYQFNEDLGLYFSEDDTDDTREIKGPFNEILDDVIANLEWLYTESEVCKTIDVLAKELYMAKSPYYTKLKKALITYLFFEQTTMFEAEIDKYMMLSSKKIDVRYSQFIASLFEEDDKGGKLKSNVKICSWNYDVQFELNLMRINKDGLLRTKLLHKIYPNINSINKSKIVDYDKDSFALFKLNGTAIPEKSLEIPDVLITPFDNYVNDEVSLLNFLKFYKDIYYKNNSSYTLRLLNFSFEKEGGFYEKYKGHRALFDAIENTLDEIEVLIVIGYSFPDFNSKIDTQLLDKIRPREIIIQDIYPDEILDRLYTRCPNLKFHVDSPGTRDSPKVIVRKMSQVQDFHYPSQYLD
jgi:hypothetical protein